MDKQNFTNNTTITPTLDRKPFARLVTVFIAGFAVGALVILATQGNNQRQPLVTAGNATSTTAIGIGSGSLTTGTTISSSANAFVGNPKSGAVSVASQSAGNTVFVQSVTVPPPGVWIDRQSVV